MNVSIETSWKRILQDEFRSQYFVDLTKKVRELYLQKMPVYPPPKLVFRAFELCPFNDVKVVILGQDPYHGVGQAHGLCFSVQDGVRVPPSLQNVYKELHDDVGASIPVSGNLERWAEQGVLLLNSVLTVEAGTPASHKDIGWEQFTDAVIAQISEKKEHVVFLLWGKYAQDKGSTIDGTKHLVLKAPHPSPFSAYTGFLGCKHFSQTNAYLEKHGQKKVCW
jgi:uracil-DNA glycosylase